MDIGENLAPDKPASTDSRRHKPIKIKWVGMIGALFIDGERWGAVEWSEKRQAWCIEDNEGQCLKHHDCIHGEDKDKAGAVALAEAMIRDGRMPTPEEATKARTERRKRDRERRAKQPSEIKRRAAKAESDRLFRASMDADSEERSAEADEPLYEVMIGALDLANPELWKSNSFARARGRLIIHMKAEIADLEYSIAGGRDWEGTQKRRLDRAREILKLLGAS